MYQNKIITESLPWVPLDYPGVFIRIIRTDPQTGGLTVLTRVDPGMTFPAHFHTHADETVFILAGDFVEDGKTYGPGAFFAGAAGTPHGPTTAARGA